MSLRVSIEPGNDLVGRFGDTVVLISRAAGASDTITEDLLKLVGELASDRSASARDVASRLATWVLGHMTGDNAAVAIVSPAPESILVFLRGPLWCVASTGDDSRKLSGEHALTWVDQILPDTFDWLAVGGIE